MAPTWGGGPGEAGGLLPDRAKAHDAKRAALEFVQFDVIDIITTPPACRDVRVLLDDAPAHRQHQQDRML